MFERNWAEILAKICLYKQTWANEVAKSKRIMQSLTRPEVGFITKLKLTEVQFR